MIFSNIDPFRLMVRVSNDNERSSVMNYLRNYCGQNYSEHVTDKHSEAFPLITIDISTNKYVNAYRDFVRDNESYQKNGKIIKSYKEVQFQIESLTINDLI